MIDHRPVFRSPPGPEPNNGWEPDGRFGRAAQPERAAHLHALGYVETQNVVIEARYAHGKPERLPAPAAELVGLRVDVILAGTTSAALAARGVTQTIPIVMAGAANPVAAGLIASLARPGGNVTGLTLETADVTAKRLELLRGALPGLHRVAAFYPGELRTFSVVVEWLQDNEAAARRLGLSLEPIDLGQEPARWDEVFSAVSARGIGAATIIETATYYTGRAQLAALALRHRLAMIFPFREQGQAGGMMAYGAEVEDLWRRAARFVDKIFKGAKPGDLPVEQPRKFTLAINLKTARALGVTIPQSLLLRVDQVIE